MIKTSTKWRSVKMPFLILCCACVLLSGVVQPLFGETPSPAENSQSDNTEPWPEKLGSRTTWERIAYFPGAVVYLPLRITFAASKETLAFVDDKRIIPRTKDFITSDDGRYGLRARYANRTGGGPKFFYKGLLSPQSKLTTSATFGLERKQQYQLRMKRVSLFGDAVLSQYLVRYRRLTNESYFGLGPESLKADESDFSHEQATVEATFDIGLGGRILLDTVLGFDLNDIIESSIAETLSELEEQIPMGRLQVGLRYDLRNTPGNPSNISEALLAAGVFQDFSDGDFSFWRASADVTYCLHLFYERVLALRLAAEIREPFSGHEIPFYYLSEIGTQSTVRGYTRGRFRDQEMVLASVEYRYPVREQMDAVLFADVGQVADDIFNDISGDDLAFGYGGGFRIWGEDGLIINLIFAKSEDRFRFFFGLE
ncbi:BamA/TamA family outer membrane protein [Candidatus Poribacteria bacterium]